MGARDSLDRFYTPEETARKCIASVPVDDYEHIVEPSAGTGAFSSLLPARRHAFDISPQHESIEQRDWFNVAREDIVGDSVDNTDSEHMLVIGNPPFGTRSTLAKNFIKHAIELGADTIAFVLPDTFTKRTNQRCFPDEWRLVQVLELSRDECTFLLGYKDEERDADSKDDEQEIDGLFIPCSFFVWTRLDDYMPNINLRDKIVPQPEQYTFLARGDENADFSVNGNNGKTKNLEDITNPKAEHYIRVSEGYDADELRSLFDDIDYDFKSSVNGGVAWVSQNDINKKFIAAWGTRK